jgi:nucleotide-binding universal stress UspA family protein
MPTTHGPILLITDLSARCDRALDRACALAKASKTKLIVLHVMDAPWLTRLARADWQAQQTQHIDQARTRLRDDLIDDTLDVEVLVETGHTLDVIEQVVSQRHCSLIVSGTARDETLGRVVLGNTVQRLARRVTVPLLIVRQRAHHAYDRLVVASDFSKGSAHALLVAYGLFDHAAITVYHAFDEVAGIYELDEPSLQEEIQARHQLADAFVQDTLTQPDSRLSVMIERGPVTDRLPSMVQEQRIRLVAVGTQGASGLTRMAMGSVAEALLDRLSCDVLMVPQADA